MRKVLASTDGRYIVAKNNLNVKPLTHLNQVVVNGHGRTIMDDEWIYVNMPGYGHITINVNRANFCHKTYLKSQSILDSIGHAKITPRLQKFIDQVSENIVFERDGVSYFVVLKRKKGVYDLARVWPYWATVGTGGILCKWNNVIKKYGGHPGWDYVPGQDRSKPVEDWHHKLDIDLTKFNFED